MPQDASTDQERQKALQQTQGKKSVVSLKQGHLLSVSCTYHPHGHAAIQLTLSHMDQQQQ